MAGLVGTLWFDYQMDKTKYEILYLRIKTDQLIAKYSSYVCKLLVVNDA